MSGRVRTGWRNGKPVIGYRKTTRTVDERRQLHEMPDWVATIRLPTELAFSVTAGAPTRVYGVTVVPGGIVRAAGKDWEWVYRQLATYLSAIAKGREVRVIATVTRDSEPADAASSPPAEPAIKGRQEIIVVPWPAVVFPRGAQKTPLVFPQTLRFGPKQGY